MHALLKAAALTIAAALPHLAAPAAAQWAPATACDQYGGAQAQDCLTKAQTRADAALNAAWKKAQAHVAASSDMSAADKKAWSENLLAAQRAWLAFRDANCRFELIGAEWNNGSGTTPAQQACVLNLTRQRTEELTKRYTSN